MARIRAVKPEFWHDELIGTLSRDARLLYMGMWNLADEHSRLRAEPRYLKAQVFPYDDDLTVDDVQRMLVELRGAGRVCVYAVNGQRYGHLPKLSKNQRLDPKVESKLPEPPPDDRRSQPDTPVRTSTDESAPSGADENASSFSSMWAGTESMEVVGVSHELTPVHATDKPPPNLSDGQRIVDAYVRGARDVGLSEPDRSLKGRVGKQATAMLSQYPLDVLLLAAQHMGEAGWHDLAVQVQRDAKAQQQSRAGPRRPPHIENGDRILQDAMARGLAQEGA